MSGAVRSSYTILCDRVFDPDTKGFAAKAIDVKDGRFLSVRPLTEHSAGGPEIETLDLRGLALLPPLVDPHIHAYMNPWPLDPKQRVAPGSGGREVEFLAARSRLEAAQLAGLGLVRDLGDPFGINLELAAIAGRERSLPRFLSSGAAVYRDGKYGRFIGTPVRDCEGLARSVRRLVDDPRIDVVKLVPTGIINFQKGRVVAAPPFSREELRMAVQIAHDHGKPVAAHCSGEPGIRLAVEAGVDFIEHGYFISRETMTLLAEKGLVWTPTFAPVQAQWNHARCCGWDAQATANLRRILDGHAEMLRFAFSIGARIMAGSDAGSPGVSHGGGLIRELELMAQAGIPEEELLATATTGAARWLLDDDTAGRIAPGCPADFIAVTGDPLRNIRQLRQIEWVAREGRIRPGRPPRMESDPDAETYGSEPEATPSASGWAAPDRPAAAATEGASR